MATIKNFNCWLKENINESYTVDSIREMIMDRIEDVAEGNEGYDVQVTTRGNVIAYRASSDEPEYAVPPKMTKKDFIATFLRKKNIPCCNIVDDSLYQPFGRNTLNKDIVLKNADPFKDDIYVIVSGQSGGHYDLTAGICVISILSKKEHFTLGNKFGLSNSLKDLEEEVTKSIEDLTDDRWDEDEIAEYFDDIKFVIDTINK